MFSKGRPEGKKAPLGTCLRRAGFSRQPMKNISRLRQKNH